MIPTEYGSLEDYCRVLGAIEREGLPPRHREILRAHWRAPGHTATRAYLAKAVGYASWKAVNLQYGKLARRIATELGLTEAPRQDHFIGPWWGHVLEDIAGGHAELGHTAYKLRPVVVSALERLGWVD